MQTLKEYLYGTEKHGFDAKTAILHYIQTLKQEIKHDATSSLPIESI